MIKLLNRALTQVEPKTHLTTLSRLSDCNFLFISLILVGLSKVTKCRRVFDRALRALPVTQHHRIWPLYVGWVKQHDIPETALRVYRR